jgi:hypothetical protein
VGQEKFLGEQAKSGVGQEKFLGEQAKIGGGAGVSG